MEAPAFEAAEVKKRARQRGGDREAQKSMTSGKSSDGSCPILKRSALAIWPDRRFGEDHSFFAHGVNNLSRQRERPGAVDVMPTVAMHDCHALLDVDGGEVFDEQPARGRSAFDVHAPIAERAGRPGHYAVRRG